MEFDDGEKKEISLHEIACTMQRNFERGNRVIAKRQPEDVPYELKFGQRVNLLTSNNSDFYPGILAAKKDDYFLVFFEDGIVQYVPRNNIFLVHNKNELKYGKYFYVLY